ncbi:MAG: tetratricopeptide repeat protein [Bacteroidaceae bacterium]|nr:tetratricopeptide repeat protein [Bacteroidaceae bacterium]
MEKKFDELYSDAQFAFSIGRYDTAIELGKKALTIAPNEVKVYSLVGNAYLVQNKLNDAEQYFVKAEDLDPNTGERYFDLGNCYFGQQRLKEALEQYASAIKLGCRDEVMQKLYYVVGIINQLDGKRAEALVNFEKADAIDGLNNDRTDILLKKTQIYVEQNNLPQAENCALQLKLLMPNEFKSYQLLFQIYLEQRKIDEAGDVLAEAEQYCGDSPEEATEIRFDRAMLYCFMAENDPEKQEVHFSNAEAVLDEIEASPDSSELNRCEAILTRADICYKLNRIDQAIEFAGKVEKITDPELAEYAERARYTLIRCFSHKNDFVNARDYARILKDSENSFYKHYSYYAEAYASKRIAETAHARSNDYIGLYNAAIAYYRNCTVTSPGDFLAYLFRAKCYVDIGKFDKAEEIGKLLPADAQANLNDYINQERRR